MRASIDQLFQPNKTPPSQMHTQPAKRNGLNQSQRSCNQREKEVIVLSSDEDEKEMFEKCLESMHFKYQVTKAQLTGLRFNVILAVTRQLMPGEPEAKARLLHQSIVQFFAQRIRINPETDYFCERIDVGLNLNSGRLSETKYLLYGTDLLSLKKIINKYCKHGPRVTRVDSSHCLLEFKSPQVGEDFLRSHVLNFRQDLLVPLQSNPLILARNWVELNTYFEVIFTRQLFIRNLTEFDEKYITNKPADFNHNFPLQEAKSELEAHLLSNEKVKLALEKLDEQQRLNSVKLYTPRYQFGRKVGQQARVRSRYDGHREQRDRTRQKYARNQRNFEDNRQSREKTLWKKNNPPTERKMPLGNDVNLPHHNDINESFSLNSNQIEQRSAINQLVEDSSSNCFINREPIRQLGQRSEVRPKFQQSEGSAEFHQLGNQLQRFHLNSSDFSSIYERSRHQISNLKLDSQGSSNQRSNLLHSNINANSQFSNINFGLSEELFYSAVHGQIREEDSDNEEIRQMLQFPLKGVEKLEANNVDLNFQITKKALDANELMRQPEDTEILRPKKPKKRQIEVKSQAVIDLC